MLVSIFVFIIVMVISVGAILSILDANRKTQTIQLVMDNVDFALEGMARTLRTGMTYHCNFNFDNPGHRLYEPRDCATGANSIVFEEAHGSLADETDNYVYQLNTTTHQIERATHTNGSNFAPITASNVEISNLMFYVLNTESATDGIQPRVIITLRGKAGGASVRKGTEFNLQTIVSQRLPDIP